MPCARAVSMDSVTCQRRYELARSMNTVPNPTLYQCDFAPLCLKDLLDNTNEITAVAADVSVACADS